MFLLKYWAQTIAWEAEDVYGVSKLGGRVSCTSKVIRALPILKKAYEDSMHKVLHIGPNTCSVVSSFLKEEREALRI